MTASDDAAWSIPPLEFDALSVGIRSVDIGVQSESNGILNDEPAVEPIAGSGQDLSLKITLTGTRASLRAGEFAELLGSTVHQPLVITPAASRGANLEGYYVADSSTSRTPRLSQPAADAEDQETLKPSFERFGTTDDHWLGVETTPVQVNHEFGNDTTPKIAIPDTATKRRWYDPDTGTVAPVGTPLAVEPTEHGDVVVYDVNAGETAVGTDGADRGPTLLYELAYADAAVVDPVVWDAAGAAYGDEYGTDYGGIAPKIGPDGVRQWAHVFATSHEFGVPVLDSGRLRVYVRESVGDVVAETWDDAASEWTGVGLDWSNTDWQLFDWDIEHISPTAIRSHAIFEHPTEGFYALEAALDRGRERVRWSVPRNESPPIPTGLEDVLAPIASGEVMDAQPVRELVRRSEVK